MNEEQVKKIERLCITKGAKRNLIKELEGWDAKDRRFFFQNFSLFPLGETCDENQGKKNDNYSNPMLYMVLFYQLEERSIRSSKMLSSHMKERDKERFYACCRALARSVHPLLSERIKSKLNLAE